MIGSTRLIGLIAMAGALVFGAGPISRLAVAEDGEIMIEAPWARASIGTKRPTAAYLTLVNLGAADRLVGVGSPIAAHASIHRTVRKGGMMSMVPAGPLDLPAGGRIEFKPGGLHIMLTGLRKPLVKGARFTLTLRFARGGNQQVSVPVASPGARKPPQ